ncbi:MAG TPA: four helix bundle protein [Polyangia bacterium]|jgi:four helix bundle protein|nr:four helix bundle protein [Polyangia bacterium]
MSQYPHDLWAFALADDLVPDAHRATAGLRVADRFGLQSQIRRGAVPVPANLVEGCARRSEHDYLHFVAIAIGSASEVRDLIRLVVRLGFVPCDYLSGNALSMRDVRMLFDVRRLLGGYSARCMGGERRRASAKASIGLATVLVCFLALVESVQAGEADDLVKQGLDLRRQGRDAQALEVFKRAHQLAPGGRTAAQVGFAEQALGMWTDAEVHLNAALRHGEDPWIKKNGATIRKSIDLVVSHLGSLDVWGKPDGAEVLVGGSVAGILPLAAPLRVSAGTVSIAVRAAGYGEMERVIEVAGGTLVRERFDLPKKSPRLAITTPGHDVGSAQDAGTRPVARLRAEPTTEPVPTESRSIFSRWWFWTLVGGVVIAGGATGYLMTHPKSTCPSGTCDGISK